MSERHAVVDLGSNTFRMVVYAAGDGWWKRIDEIYEPVRVGEGLTTGGALLAKPMKRGLAAVDVFAHFAEAANITADELDAVATSAIREASNGDEFVEQARRAGLEVRVLSREEEARYGYLAAVNSTALTEGCVLDIGGGSMQLVKVVDRRPVELDSWRLGAVRMTERFLADGEKASRKQLDRLRAHVAGKLARDPWITSCGPLLVGIGGTVRNLAAAAQRAQGIPDVGVQGWRITPDALAAIIDDLAALPAAQRAKVPGIKPGRADVILAGAVVIQTVIEEGGFDGLEATEAGLREGVFFERLLQDRDEPLLGDVRRASVENLAAQYPTEPVHTAHVAHLALQLFDDLAAQGVHGGDPQERELLWAASLLHDVGMTIDYDDHHKHSRYLILNAGLPGFSPQEVALIAQAVKYHRKGMPDADYLAPLITTGKARRQLDRLAVLLRLAEDLERSRDQLVERVDVTARGDEVLLELVAHGSAAVPRWAAAREVDAFARAFGRKLVVAEAAVA